MAEYKIDKNTKFEYVNPNAEVVIVGITPGNSKLKGNREGMSPREIKRKYAFAGKMKLKKLLIVQLPVAQLYEYAKKEEYAIARSAVSQLCIAGSY